MNEVSKRVDIGTSADSAAGASACLLGPPRSNARIKVDSEQTVVTRPPSTHDHVLVTLRTQPSRFLTEKQDQLEYLVVRCPGKFVAVDVVQLEHTIVHGCSNHHFRGDGNSDNQTYMSWYCHKIHQEQRTC